MPHSPTLLLCGRQSGSACHCRLRSARRIAARYWHPSTICAACGNAGPGATSKAAGERRRSASAHATATEAPRFRIPGLGIFQVSSRAARMGRNPATGEPVQIKASKKIAFRPAKELKEAI